MGRKKLKDTKFRLAKKKPAENRRPQADFETYLDSIEGDEVHSDIIKDIEFDILEYTHPIPMIDNSAQVLPALGELSKQLQTAKQDLPQIPQYEESKYSVLDMDGHQFSVRMKNGLYTLNPIRTRLQWQAGEFPTFRAEARHYNAMSVPFKERRRMMRKAQGSSIINPEKSEYLDYEYPQDDWPIKGQLYITNMQVLFRVNRHNITPMPFDMIYNYYFYRNALEIVYLKGKEKKTDVFFIDEDNMRIAETFLRLLG